MSGFVAVPRELWREFRHERETRELYVEIAVGAEIDGPNATWYVEGYRALGRRVGGLHHTQVVRRLKDLGQWIGWRVDEKRTQGVLCRDLCHVRAMFRSKSGAFVPAVVPRRVPHLESRRAESMDLPPTSSTGDPSARPAETAAPAAHPLDANVGVEPENASKGKTPRRVGTDRHSQFIAWWVREYPAHHEGHAYTGMELAGGKEGAAVKRLLKAFHDGKELARVVLRAWSGERPYWTERSCSFAGLAQVAAEVAAAPAFVAPSRNGRSPAFSAIEERFRILERQTAEDMEKRGAP